MTIEEAKIIVQQKYQGAGGFVHIAQLSAEEEKRVDEALQFLIKETFKLSEDPSKKQEE